MKQAAIIAAMLLLGAIRAGPQGNADILWARGGSVGGFPALLYSPFTQTVIATTGSATTGGPEWDSWPTGLISLPLRIAPSFLSSSVGISVLTKGGRELISGLLDGDVYAWDLTTNSLSFIFSLPSYPEYFDATLDGSLIAACTRGKDRQSDV